MNLEEAIKTAIEYETRIRDVYREAAESTGDPVGRRVFGSLAEDEQRHIDYLEQRMSELQEDGAITVAPLETLLPPSAGLRAAADRVKAGMERDDRRDEKRMLGKALQAEIETSEFYRKLTRELTEDARRMFSRFLEIEEGHIVAVQAELDYLSGTGYWLDIKEFDME